MTEIFGLKLRLAVTAVQTDCVQEIGGSECVS